MKKHIIEIKPYIWEIIKEYAEKHKISITAFVEDSLVRRINIIHINPTKINNWKIKNEPRLLKFQNIVEVRKI